MLSNNAEVRKRQLAAMRHNPTDADKAYWARERAKHPTQEDMQSEWLREPKNKYLQRVSNYQYGYQHEPELERRVIGTEWAMPYLKAKDPNYFK